MEEERRRWTKRGTKEKIGGERRTKKSKKGEREGGERGGAMF